MLFLNNTDIIMNGYMNAGSNVGFDFVESHYDNLADKFSSTTFSVACRNSCNIVVRL